MSDFEKNDDTMSEALTEEKAAKTENGATMSARKREKIIRSVSAVLFALIFLFAGILGGWFLGVSSVDERARNLAWLVERVEANYYKEVDDDTLYDNLFSALELDKFCSYYNVDEYDSLISESMGQNSGFGVSLIYEDGAVRLYRTVFNSPAERAGLEAGMYIYRFGGTDGTMQQATSDNFYAYLSSHNEVTVEAGYDGSDKKTVTISRAASGGK